MCITVILVEHCKSCDVNILPLKFNMVSHIENYVVHHAGVFNVINECVVFHVVLIS